MYFASESIKASTPDFLIPFWGCRISSKRNAMSTSLRCLRTRLRSCSLAPTARNPCARLTDSSASGHFARRWKSVASRRARLTSRSVSSKRAERSRVIQPRLPARVARARIVPIKPTTTAER